jgi:hypothetical protein
MSPPQVCADPLQFQSTQHLSIDVESSRPKMTKFATRPEPVSFSGNEMLWIRYQIANGFSLDGTWG